MLCVFWTQLLFAQTGTANKTGTASFYATRFDGRKTASGQVFSNKQLTAASNHYKLGTRLRVTNLTNKQTVIVTVNDRMEAGSRRLVDLTQQAAKQLCFLNSGLCKVEIEVLDDKETA